MTKKVSSIVVVLVLVMTSPGLTLVADGEYLTQPELFLQQVFDQQIPEASMIWLSGERADIATTLLGHRPEYLRLRYWGDENRTAWIVDEIGKTEPITIGVVVARDEIESMQVLAFRESRGWEIKHDFFTRQFVGASLTPGHDLSHFIDGISGATLSVRAMKNVSKLVLYLSQVSAD